jgi:hypothetical protein
VWRESLPGACATHGPCRLREILQPFGDAYIAGLLGSRSASQGDAKKLHSQGFNQTLPRAGLGSRSTRWRLTPCCPWLASVTVVISTRCSGGLLFLRFWFAVRNSSADRAARKASNGFRVLRIKDQLGQRAVYGKLRDSAATEQRDEVGTRTLLRPPSWWRKRESLLDGHLYL